MDESKNPSNPFGIVPLSNFVRGGFGFVHHSIAILLHQVPNPNLFHRCVPGERAGVGSGARETHADGARVRRPRPLAHPGEIKQLVKQ
jgi:hypothetical protein